MVKSLNKSNLVAALRFFQMNAVTNFGLNITNTDSSRSITLCFCPQPHCVPTLGGQQGVIGVGEWSAVFLPLAALPWILFWACVVCCRTIMKAGTYVRSVPCFDWPSVD